MPEKERPRFLDAWPIRSAAGVSASDLEDRADVDVLYRVGPDATAVFCRRGWGGLMVIGDSRFFSSMNIESMSGHWVGNLAFLHNVFREYLSVDPAEVAPLFPSPEMPE